MPGVAPDSSARILEWLELEPVFPQTDGSAVIEEELAIGRDEVREAFSLPQVAMEPEATIHGVDHSIAELFEFFKRRRDVGHVAAALIAGDDSGDRCRRNRRRASHEQRAEVRIGKRVRRGGGPPGCRRFDDHDRVAPRGVELQGI